MNMGNLNRSENKEMTDSSIKSLCRIIKQRRLMIPMTLSTVSRISGISVSYLSRIENGKKTPSVRTVQRLAMTLGFKEGELFCLDDQ